MVWNTEYVAINLFSWLISSHLASFCSLQVIVNPSSVETSPGLLKHKKMVAVI